MKNVFLIQYLSLNEKDILFIVVMKKYQNLLLNFVNKLLKTNFYQIPYTKDDAQQIIYKTMINMRSLNWPNFQSWEFLTLLKSLIVRYLIQLQKHFNYNKRGIWLKIMSYDNDDQNFQFPDNSYKKIEFNLMIDNFQEFLKNNVKNPYCIQVFKYYIENYTPKLISSELNLTTKQIYNLLFIIKRFAQSYLTDTNFN